MIKAIIFDMDGVISDTPKMGAKINRELFLPFGIDMSEEQITKDMAGIPDTESVPKIFVKHGITISPEEIENVMHTKWEKLKFAYKNNAEKIEGSVAFIEKLHDEGFLLAVASSSRKDFVMTVLESLDIKTYFSAIVSMEDVIKGKPEPDIFLFAAKKLNVNPSECLVIEDAPAGIQAGKKAGMKVIAITSTHQKDELTHADRIIKAYTEIDTKQLPML